jgi:hypothetical protein
MKHFYFNLTAICFLALWGRVILADDFTELSKEEEGRYERVGGTYEVTDIEQKDDGTFLINFQSVVKGGKFEFLKLESDHVHFSVVEGQKIRLSAEILGTKGNVTEVSQVLLFLPTSQGVTPVWMLSRKGQDRDLRGSKYLEMHSPQNDFNIL